ncbi:MAG: bifunctional aldolase/short-chain dehydrogenase [Magnetococcales bacterium]|nr:bifunctional aldolase/short-chain dehydrogenase [Magnetococcales bacterium]MBF0151052.1 bifunctional aldolase/short-chain dehydrogenase [Magnetococcales bacterium]
MENHWSQEGFRESLHQWGPRHGEKLALRTLTSRLLGREPKLVLHGGGNTSVKGETTDILGQPTAAIFIKGSGIDLARITPEQHPALNLAALLRLRNLTTLSPRAMVNQLRLALFDAAAPTPSIEALMHAFLPHTFIDHTHPEAILTLGNQPDGRQRLQDALGEKVIILEYIHPGFELAKEVVSAWEQQPDAQGMVLLRHGLITWGGSAQESYEATLQQVNRAEAAIDSALRHGRTVVAMPVRAAPPWSDLAPEIRGALVEASGGADDSSKRFILRPLDDPETLALLQQPNAASHFVNGPLTSDHIIRCKPWPMWLDDPSRIREAFQRYRDDYRAYFQRHAASLEPGVEPFDAAPRVILVPGMGGFIAGENVDLADIARDITRQTLSVKAKIAAMGTFLGLDERQLFDMEYFSLQHAKLRRAVPRRLEGRVAVITGAAGAIGSGICRRLLQEGAHVAATDLGGAHLDSLVSDLATVDPKRILGVAMDVTDEGSVADGLRQVIQTWGGIDLVIINAGLAHVAPLAALEMKQFRKLHQVNVEGTLSLLSHSARLFARQNTGGDVVVISTKNVFAPGAGFGAYSATKAASHQLARIASLELASLDVRVNMVAPDAVFSDGQRKSGLWAEVGPDRMRARGLDEAGLEAYYRNRNLLKVAVTADHVANAVLFFATRQTPTTGATIPVDGGLPDATPR